MTVARVEKRDERAIIEQRMAELAGKIARSMLADPDNFDAREPLWIERERLRATLEG